MCVFLVFKVRTVCASDFDCTNNAHCQGGSCQCRKGFQARGAICQDVDECKGDRNPCGEGAVCLNRQGGYDCQCPSPLVTLTSKGGQCRDPCEDVNCGRHASCQIEGEEAYCVCQVGWTYNPKEISAGCVDIDECDKSISPWGKCGANTICTNVPGKFNCACQPGYSGDPFANCYDVDECLENRLICGREAECVNRPGSYSCRCLGEGGRFDPATLTCIGGHGGHGTGLSVTTSCSSNEQCVGNAVCSSGACLCPPPNLGPNCESKKLI